GDGGLLANADLFHLTQQFGQGRDIEVAFQQGRQHAETLVGLFQQGPDSVLHGGTVGIDLQVRRFVVVAGHMQVHHSLRRQRGQVGGGVVTVVDRVDVEVVDVQQQVAVGLFQYRAEKVDLLQRLIGRGVVGNV